VAARLLRDFAIQLVAITLGGRGCELYRSSEFIFSPAPLIKFCNAVGAGDAFSAALVTGLMQGLPLEALAIRANQVGAYVASQPGAMPRLAMVFPLKTGELGGY
jgi:fructokinase